MTAGEDRHFRPGERAYILNHDSLPVYVGEGSGNLDYKDAVDFSIIKRTNLGLPASLEYIQACAPPPEEPKGEWKDYSSRSKDSRHAPRASKNNPYVCIYCGHKSTRHGNMVAHLKKSHNDYTTDPRDNHY